MRRYVSPLLFLLTAAFSISVVPRISHAGTPAEANFVDSSVASSLGNITSMTWAPDGSNRLFLTIKTGPVTILQNGTALSPSFYTFIPYLGHHETGVLSLAFDPNYATNKYVYVFYTASSTIQKIVRLTDNNNVGQSLLELKSDLPTAGQNHDGGSMIIGPDHNGNGNYLYWAVGNLGNNTGEGANLTSLASKMGRMTLSGAAPTDNPFYNSADGIGPTDFVWARGFRNPFTMSLNPTTKKPWVNIVGDGYEQIFVVQRGDYVGDRYNENKQDVPPGTNPPSVTPIIKYRTNGNDSRTITSAIRSSNVVTYTTSSTHGFRRGESITIAGVGDTSFNGTYSVTSVPSLTTFTVSQSAANASSSGGTAATQNLGGCVTGGAFYNATAFPAAYQGNYFFGDFNSNKIYRVVLDGSGNVSSISLFATGTGPITDVSVGLDGALYYSDHNGNVRRITYNNPSQSIVVSSTSVGVTEGALANFTVNLAAQPSSNVTVTVARTSGDSDITVNSGATLTFTPSNYAQPQQVQIGAAQDADTANDSAVITVSSSGLTSRTVNIAAADDDSISLVLSTGVLSFTEGGSATFNVRLSNQPSANVVVSSARTSGDATISVTAGSSLTFTPSNYAVNQTVTVTAAEDADTTGETAVITASSSGISSATVNITIADNDAMAPVIVSSAVIGAVQSAPYTYDVNANGLPVPTYALVTAPSGMTINATSGVISWTPSATGSFNVSVRATNGVSPDATQSFTVTVLTDTKPTCTITAPTAGAVVSGTTSEFFGDAFDDVGTTKAEFSIDGVLKYTDINDDEHYHINGGHLLWNTTLSANGDHVLRMTVYDTKGQSGFCEVTAKVANIPSAPQNLRVTP